MAQHCLETPVVQCLHSNLAHDDTSITTHIDFRNVCVCLMMLGSDEQRGVNSNRKSQNMVARNPDFFRCFLGGNVCACGVQPAPYPSPDTPAKPTTTNH